MQILHEQAQQTQTLIDEKEATLGELKEMFDNESKSIKDELSVLKRVLKTTKSAIAALSDDQAQATDNE